MQNLIWRDVRLNGWKPNEPKGTKVMECNLDTPLQWFVDYSKSFSETFKGKDNVSLKLMAHGYYTAGSGGYGIQFCKEDLKITNLEKLYPLRDRFKGGVTLFSCGAAAITPGSGAGNGNGAILCRRIAMILNTNVTAADAKQLYGMGTGPTHGIDFGKWQGNVFTWDKNGKLLTKETHPLD